MYLKQRGILAEIFLNGDIKCTKKALLCDMRPLQFYVINLSSKVLTCMFLDLATNNDECHSEETLGPLLVNHLIHNLY